LHELRIDEVDGCLDAVVVAELLASIKSLELAETYETIDEPNIYVPESLRIIGRLPKLEELYSRRGSLVPDSTSCFTFDFAPSCET